MDLIKSNVISLFICVVILIVLSSCAVPHARIFVNNSACASSLASAVVDTISPDWDKKTIDKAKSIDLKTRLSAILYIKVLGREFNSFGIGSQGIQYSYLFQKEGHACWLKLYKKESSDSNYTNTITYIRSQKIDKCRCGGNDMSIQVGL